MSQSITAFRSVPRTGVIYVTTEARKRGFSPGASHWCNLGQGMPETGPLPGSPPRVASIATDERDHEYAPVPGLGELRESVAHLYNQLYRKGMPSQYDAENVLICAGGRGSLVRAAAALNNVNLGHFLPDYTAYEELLDIFRGFTPIPILLDAEKDYAFSPQDLRREILGRGLGAVLLSNPCNPTGKLIAGNDLAAWVETGRDLDCALIFDEFYSHYIWNRPADEPGPFVSAARYVEDVDRDPVLILDGLTKNWRYPGWRVTWAVGPKPVIQAMGSAASFLDGGASAPMQRAALPLVNVERAIAEGQAITKAFAPKRQLVMDKARKLGFRIPSAPDATFYAFASLADMAPELQDGDAFFRAALDKQVICVPGAFFDVNPGQRRRHPSRFAGYVRISFGPPIAEVTEGMERLATLSYDGPSE